MTPRLQPNEFSVTGEPGLYINYAKFMDELLKAVQASFPFAIYA